MSQLRPQAEDVLCKTLLVHGKVNKYCHWHRGGRKPADKMGEDESAKKKKKREVEMSVSKLKLQAARSEHTPQPTDFANHLSPPE